jgi:hypothetical protein
MEQYTKKITKPATFVSSGKKCRVATNVKAGWKWFDDFKEKVSNNLNKVKNI